MTGADWARLGDAAERVAHFIGHQAFMRMQEGRCIALEMRRDATGCDFYCSIYERRPQICRDLARGSAECAAEVERKAADTLAAADLSGRTPPASAPLPPAARR